MSEVEPELVPVENAVAFITAMHDIQKKTTELMHSGLTPSDQEFHVRGGKLNFEVGELCKKLLNGGTPQQVELSLVWVTQVNEILLSYLGSAFIKEFESKFGFPPMPNATERVADKAIKRATEKARSIAVEQYLSIQMDSSQFDISELLSDDEGNGHV